MVKTKKKKSLKFKNKMAWLLGLVMICVFGTMLSGENVQGADTIRAVYSIRKIKEDT